MLANLGADFITATMNSGADGGLEIPPLGAEAAAHFSHAFLDNTQDRAAPAGVEDSHRSVLSIDKNYGQTIGGLNGEQKSGSCGDQAVAGQLFVRHVSYTMDQVGVDLAQRDQRSGPITPQCPEFSQESGAVALHCAPPIVFGEAEVQGVPTVNPRATPYPRAEAVAEPRNAHERIGVKNGDWGFLGPLGSHQNILDIRLML